MKKDIISGGQLIGMMFWTIMGTAILTLPILIGIHAPRDAWMAAVIFILGGLLLCLIIRGLSKIFPETSFVGCLQNTFGGIIGKILIIIFFIWLFHTSSFVIWQISNFTKISLLPNTPELLIMLILLLPSLYAIYGGIECIARSSQLIFIISFTVLLFLFFIHIPEVDITNLLPMFDDGLYNIYRSSLAPLAWAGEIMFVLFFFQNINKKRSIATYSAVSILLIGIGGIINEFFYTTVFGPLRQYLTNPFYTLVRYINPDSPLERYDILFVTINLTGNFIKLSVFIYILVFGLSQLFGMKNYRPFILPVSAGLVILTYFSVEGQTQLINYLNNFFPYYTIPLLYGLPLLTLIVAKLRKL